VNEIGSGTEEDWDKRLHGHPWARAARFAIECLGGVPVVGGLFGATAGAWSEREQGRAKQVLIEWIRLIERDIDEIGRTMAEIVTRIDLKDDSVRERIRSEGYLTLLRKAFREWSAAESEQKRGLVRTLLCNAASARVCSDDVLRLFLRWIDEYDEAHFLIIRRLHQAPESTRYEIWLKIHGEEVSDDSAEADLFARLIHDLTVGRVIRQHREVDSSGRFLRKRAKQKSSVPYLKSRLDDEEPYELTKLGAWFVHYTMHDVVPLLAANSPDDATPASRA